MTQGFAPGKGPYDEPEPDLHFGQRVLLTTLERELIEALRADPDQERHIVDCRARNWQANAGPRSWNRHDFEIVVRHPVSERLRQDALFECPVLLYAETWLDDEDEPVGRWRHLPEQGEFERVDDMHGVKP